MRIDISGHGPNWTHGKAPMEVLQFAHLPGDSNFEMDALHVMGKQFAQAIHCSVPLPCHGADGMVPMVASAGPDPRPW